MSRQSNSDVPFWQSQTMRLTVFYLAVIMAMSIGYSVVLYSVSASQLEGRLLNEAISDDKGRIELVPRVQKYLEQQVDLGKQELVLRLIVLNSIMGLFGVAISYLLARKTLEPIENNMQAQARFVSDVSHELRTPLTSLQTQNEVTLRSKKLRLKDARQVIADNLEEVARLQRLTNSMLDLAADDPVMNRTKVGLHDIVSKAVTIVAPLAVERKISLDDKSKDVSLFVDVDAVTQAIIAVVDNAIKYSPSESKVRLTTDIKRQFVHLKISDNGVGINAREQKRIFERFYRSDSARTRQQNGGYGLGLSIAYKIIRAHGGDITLKSKVGQGSTFTLVLPRDRTK